MRSRSGKNATMYSIIGCVVGLLIVTIVIAIALYVVIYQPKQTKAQDAKKPLARLDEE